jgi:hypothetical protein
MNEIAPFRQRPGVLSLLSIDHGQHIASIRLIVIQQQRRQYFLLRLGQHPAPLVDQAEIEVRLRMIGTKQSRYPRRLCSLYQMVILQIGKAHVQEQIPEPESERCRTPVLFDFIYPVIHHSVRKAKVVMSQRTVGMFFENHVMKPNGFVEIFDARK